MENHRDIYLKVYGQPVINITRKGGYIFELQPNTPWTKYYEDLYSPNSANDYNELYTSEINTVYKISYNEEGYFDFSKNMIDIGANVYTFSFLLPFNYSHCFEANKLFTLIGELNMYIHKKEDKYKTYNVLLSDKEETIKYDGFTAINVSENSGFDIVDTPTKTIDSYKLDNIGFIKIDVEGMEYKVLSGALDTIRKNNYPPILFELWDVGKQNMTLEKHDKLQHFLENLGYEILWYWGDHETHLAIHK